MRLPLAVLALFAAPALSGSTLEVPLGFATIQAALDAAVSGDTVRVAPGTYKEHDLVVVGKDIVLFGTGGATLTIIDAEGLGRCLSVTGTGAGEVRIEGFTLRGGRPQAVGAGQPGGDGGGLLFSSGGLVVAGCVFEGNEAGLGGAGVKGASPKGAGGSGGRGGHGGGLAVTSGATSVRIEGSVFAGNAAGNAGSGGAGGTGKWGKPGTVFTPSTQGIYGGNGGSGGHGGRGGAVFIASGSNVLIQNNTMVDNRVGIAGAGGPPGSGGGWGATGPPPTQGPPGQPGRTGGIQAEGVALLVQHNTLLDNQSFAVQAPQASAVHNSILRGALAATQIQGPALVTYNNIQGGAAGTNIDAPPQFVDEAGRDLRLTSASPCIDAGDASLASLPSSDLEGDPRKIGAGVDIGSDERYLLAGTGEDLDAKLTVNGAPKGTATSAAVTAGDSLAVVISSQTFAGAPLLLAFQPFASSTPMPLDPTIAGVALNTTWPGLTLLSSPPLPAAGLRLELTVPPGLTGLTVRLQAFALSSTATNGTWASSRGLEARIE